MKILKKLDARLNQITMYRLVMYSLMLISGYAIVCGFLGLLPFTGVELLLSFVLLGLLCNGFNWLIAKLFRAPTNVESSSITALLLFLILVPVVELSDFWVIVGASAIAMTSKYLLAIKKKHLFNPVAIAAVGLMIMQNGNAIWWVGTPVMLPVVTIGGLLVVRKIRRAKMLWAFLITSFAMVTFFNLRDGKDLLYAWQVMILSWPLVFFGTYMLTEPLTTPPTRKLQIVYGALAGYLMSSRLSLGSFYFTPEVALVVSNLFSYLVSPKQKLILHFKEKHEVAKETYDFTFEAHEKLVFEPGQYIEWTFAHEKIDDRGNRRYFTLASSPTERDVHLGVKITPQKSSSFKSALMAMQAGDSLVISQLAGDFTLDKDAKHRLVFIAGGIGVTPFRSMVKYLMDKNEKREIVMFYAAMSSDAFAYKELFAQAQQSIGMKTVYLLSGAKDVPQGWNGKVGFLTQELLSEEVQDYKENVYYISGPQAMVSAYKEMLQKAGVANAQIRTDYFPGF